MLVGRGREIRLVHELLERAFLGEALVLLVQGEAGVGKTALLSACGDAVRDAGGVSLNAQCERFARARPFGPLLDAVHAADVRRTREARDLIERVSRTDARSSPLERGPELRSLLVDDLVTQLEELGNRGPLAVCIDDVHWADSATLLTLGSLVRRVTDLPFLLVVTARPGSYSPELTSLLDGLERGEAVPKGRFTRLDLAPLEQSDVSTLAERLAGAPPGPRLARMLERCGGNPLLVVEVVTQLRETGQLREDRGRVDAHLDTDGHLSPTLAEGVRSRMAQLEGETRAVATIGALLGARFSLSDLGAVTGRPVTDLLALVSELVAARVVDHDGEAYRFRHDLVREAVVDSIPPGVQAELHETIAKGLRAAGAPLQVVAEHVALGPTRGSNDAVAILRDAAAQLAAKDPAGAASLLRRALEMCPPTDPAHDALLAALVDALAWSGETVEAQAIADEVLTRPLQRDVEERVRSALGRSLLLLGRPAEAIPHEERLIALHAELDRSPAWALAECAICRLFGFDIDGAMADSARAIELAMERPDPAAEVLALCTQVFAQNALGNTAAAVELGTRAVRIADTTASMEGHRLHPQLFRGIALLSSGDRPAALAAFTRGRQLGESLGATWALPIYHFTIALAHWDAGQWDDLLAEADAGITYGAEQSSSIGQVWAYAIAGRVHLHRGELEDASAKLDRGDAVLAESGLQVGADWLALSRALLLEAVARRDEAVELLQLVWETATDLQASASLVLIGPDLTRLALDIGNEALAERVVGALGEIAQAVPADRIVGARERRSRGLLRRDPEVLVEAVELLHAQGFPFEAALVRAEAADLLAATGRPDQTAAMLEQALTTFDRVGAHLDSERTRARLARVAPVRRRPQRAVSGWNALTATEREVVEEVCTGRTNRQVAERLGVSRRTVEAHLRSIYSKLDVSTRLALAVAHRERQEAGARV